MTFEAARLAALVPVLALVMAAPTSVLGQEDLPLSVQRAVRPPSAEIGLPVGQRIPAFEARDQHGDLRDFETVRGPNGAVIYFYRSASWCIYCRAQLIETERSKEAILSQGLGIVGISYDPVDALEAFASEHGISFPLLSDPHSTIIRELGVLDATALPGTPAYGVPYHGSYVVDASGVVVAKLFDAEAVLDHSSGVVVSRLFGSPLETHSRVVRHDRLTLSYYASRNAVSPGDEIELWIDVAVNDGLHVYAPPAEGLVPVSWDVENSAVVGAGEVTFPEPRVADFGEETVAIYTGRFSLSRPLEIVDDPIAFERALDAQGNLVVEGTFGFQACDEQRCYLPKTISLEWRLAVLDAAREAPHHAHAH